MIRLFNRVTPKVVPLIRLLLVLQLLSITYCHPRYRRIVRKSDAAQVEHAIINEKGAMLLDWDLAEFDCEEAKSVNEIDCKQMLEAL